MTKCIDTSVWIPYLLPETLQPQARNLITPLLTSNIRLVAPAFAWTEVGSVLRKKVKIGSNYRNPSSGIL
ncbi:MAG: type II toxin-antitoxin system VapC family toxin [Phormidium sp.]